MLSVPLPFLVGVIFALALHQSLRGVDAPGSRRFFVAFLVLYACQGLIVGLRFGYGVAPLAYVQPVTAAFMPPLAYLAFKALTGETPSGAWLHLGAPAIVLLAVLVMPSLIDPLLLGVFLGYGIALWRLTGHGNGNGDVMAEASLQRMVPALRAARLTAGLMLFFALSDGILAVYAAVAGTGSVPFAVTIVNLLALAVIAAFCLAPQSPVRPPRSDLPQAGVTGESQEDDAAVLALVNAVLDEGLYLDENLSLAKLARKAGFPARSVSTAVNRSTGLNVSQFVNNRRIREACRLLQETDRSATAIMLEAGFSTKSNFNREFRRVTGKSPRAWRSASRAGSAPLDVRPGRNNFETT